MTERPDKGSGSGSVSRRRFLAVAGGTAGLAWELTQLNGGGSLAARLVAATTADGEAGAAAPTIPIITRTLRRSDDQLQLKLSFHNWQISRSGGRSRLVRQGDDAPVVITFPSQSFGEETFTPGVESAAPPPGQQRVRYAQPSRLVFDLPADITTLAANDTAALLDWRRWALRVVPAGPSTLP